MGRQHIVVRRHDRHIAGFHHTQTVFITFTTGSKAVCKVAAAKFSALWFVAVIFFDLAYIICTQTGAALYNTLSDSGYLLVDLAHNGSELNIGEL